MTNLSHVDDEGRARMVDVSDKSPTDRRATASGWLRCSPSTLAAVAAGQAPKGSVISTAELAGVMGAKRTADLIPLCHPLALTKVAVEIGADENLPGFRVVADVRCTGPTGVEMEALTAVTISCLTLYDMLKAVDRSMEIGSVQLNSKSGGADRRLGQR